jgi:hypothetical protein
MPYLIDLTKCCPASPFEKGGLRGIFFTAFQFCDTLIPEKATQRVAFFKALKSIYFHALLPSFHACQRAVSTSTLRSRAL